MPQCHVKATNCTKNYRKCSHKHRKLTTSEEETDQTTKTNECGKHCGDTRKCSCYASEEEEKCSKVTTSSTATSLRKRMVAILSPSVSNKNLSTILSTDTSELYQQVPPDRKKTFRKDRKKCLKHAETSERHCRCKSSSSNCNHKRNDCKKKKVHICKNSAAPPQSAADLPKCQVCSKVFDSPILLSCGHTFCKECVTVFVEASDGTSFNCPVCESDIKLSGDEEELFCPNFVFLKQLDADANDNSLDELLCAVCQCDVQAEYYCETCQDLLCGCCAHAHKVVKYTKNHRVLDIDCSTNVSSLIKKRYYCPDHETLLLDIYCTCCDKCVCRKCAQLFHRGDNHATISVKVAAEKVKHEMRRQLYDFKSRAPNLQLALMDLKHAKGTMREQANVTYAEINESMSRIMTALKEHEKRLYKKLEDVCQTKASALKSQKNRIFVQLEKFETLSNVLQQLDNHDNDIETLQMRTTIRACADKLENDKFKVKCAQSSVLFNTNEFRVKRELCKHGEIFHYTSNDGSDKRTLDFDNNGKFYIVSNFSDRISASTISQATSTDSDGCLRKSAKKIRAKSNWMILKSRLPDLIKPSDTRPRGHHKGRRMKSSATMRRKEMSRARREKARANWMILRSHLSDIAESDVSKQNPSRQELRTTTKLPKRTARKQQKMSRRAMSTRALRQRANANWLLLRSKLPEIVDYGRVTGRLFSSFKVQIYTKRSSPTMMKLKRFRAKTLRARANWLLVASRVPDIARYPEKVRKSQKEKVTWDSYINELNANRRKATRNKYVAGVLRARANWMIVRSRIPDIILYGKYRRYRVQTLQDKTLSKSRDKKSNLKRSNSKSSLRSSRDSLNRLPSKHRHKDDERRRKHKHRSSKLHAKQPRVMTKGKIISASENWNQLVHNTPSCKHSPSKKKTKSKSDHKKANAYKGWDQLIRETSTDKKVGRSSSYKSKDPYRNWDQLTKNTPGKAKHSSHKSKDPYGHWDHLTKNIPGQATVQRSSSLKSKEPYKHWDQLTKNTPGGAQGSSSNANWDILIHNTAGESKDKSSLRSGDAFMNWDNLMHAKDQNKGLADWDQLIVGTSTLSPSRRAKSEESLSLYSQSEKHWHKLTDTAKQDKREAEENWLQLTGKARYEREAAERNWGNLARSTRTSKSRKPSERARRQWDKIKSSLGRLSRDEVDGSQRSLAPAQEAKAYKNWWALAQGVEGSHASKRGGDNDEDIRDKAVRKRVDSVCGAQSSACQNWNTLIQGTLNVNKVRMTSSTYFKNRKPYL